MSEIIVRSGTMLTETLIYFLRLFCAQQWGVMELRSALLKLWLHVATQLQWVSLPQHQKTWHGGSWGASSVLLFETGVSGWWSADADTWESLSPGSVCLSHPPCEQQPAGNSHFHSCVAIPQHNENCIRLFFCRNKHGWMGSDSFVRKVWKLVTESRSGGVWGDEQGTGYKAVVICFCRLCSAYMSN